VLLDTACVILISSEVFAQNITEYGHPSELKGVTKIFISLVFAGSVELKDRNRIIKEIENAERSTRSQMLKLLIAKSKPKCYLSIQR